ncbi:PqqD family protein [Dongia deserti]|uniref:PqqD family protein n=1 Tax=Dongia deserti TaxID=2268030 RepID=UPI000E65BADE|nr:PqqD family protein [Dongia deserti]
MLMAFEGIARPIELDGCEELRGRFGTVFRGWRMRKLASSADDPVIALRKKNNSYRLETPSLGPAIHQPTDISAVCAFIADLVEIYVADEPSLLCLHSGAAAFPDGLVMFPNQFRAGKSTLLARLAASSVPVFADDVLPICRSSRQGVALGIAPRLRLPLPKNAGVDFRRFVRAHSGPSDNRYLYLDLPPEVLIRHGRRMPVAACVLLDRRPRGKAQLVPTSKSLGLQRAIRQNFARSVSAADIADCLHDLLRGMPCYTLRYSSLDDAASLLLDVFQGRTAPNQEVKAAPAPQSMASNAMLSDARHPKARCDGLRNTGRYRRNPAIILRAVENDAFLVDPRGQSIYHLNPVAAGLWRLLHKPTSVSDAAAAISNAFPAVDAATIKGDVQALIADLHANKLIERCHSRMRRARH